MKRFKSFKLCETTHEVIRELPDKMLQLKYYIALCDYGLYEIEPNFSPGLETSIWLQMKALVDFSSYRSKTNSDNGKKGGAPVGNQNARKQPETTGNNRKQPDITSVIQEAKKYGYFIDKGTAQNFLELENPEWLTGNHSFINFTAERIAEKYYSKSAGEKNAIFISAIKTWDNLRYEYPEWKTRKEKRETETLWQAAFDTAWENHPIKCIHCGEDVFEYAEEFVCKPCSVSCGLNKNTFEWEWRKL